jgi:tetrahydromethanopterin S-methyltransferase subunit G
MKRFFMFLLVVTFLPATTTHAQAGAVTAPILEALQATHLVEQALYWGKQAADMVEQIQKTSQMLQNMGRQVQNQINNLKNVSNIHNPQEFMTWYNRQLEIERRTEETWNNMNITIGKKKYSLTDIEGIAYGLKDTYVDYWNKEFTEEQRKEMWVSLGVTPANYAYIQTWKEREQQMAREFLTARAIHNKDFIANMKQDMQNLQFIEADKLKSEDDPTKMGDKGAALINAETNIASNVILNKLEGHLADIKESMAIKLYQKITPSDELPMSMWTEDGFGRLK